MELEMHFFELGTKELTMSGNRNWFWAALVCGLLMGCGGGGPAPAPGGGDIVSLPQELTSARMKPDTILVTSTYLARV